MRTVAVAPTPSAAKAMTLGAAGPPEFMPVPKHSSDVPNTSGANRVPP